jgi:prolactin regulatory element-binding protein
MSDRELPELLCRVDFPLYAATMISPRHLLLAGGGGAANTGVKNGFEIFEITHNGEQSLGKSVTRYVSGDYSIMSISASNFRPCGNNNNTAPPKILAAAGHNEFCQVYSLSLARDRPFSEGSPSGGLRHRQTNGSPGRTQEQASTGAGQDTETNLVYRYVFSSIVKLGRYALSMVLIFRTQPLKRVQIDFAEQEPYVKVLRISLNGKLLATGGDDGHLR